MAEQAATAFSSVACLAPEQTPQVVDVEIAAQTAEAAAAILDSEAAAAGLAPSAPPVNPALPQLPKELENDAAVDTRPKLKSPVEFLAKDTTLNVMPSLHGNILMALTDGGIQHLLAGARANVGITSGRYMFELRMVEMLNPGDTRGQKGGRSPQPLNMLRVGFSTSRSSLILGSSEENFCFDAGGALIYNKSSSRIAEGFGRDNTISLMLNLDAASPNANTVSIFRDGVRICQPQPIPEKLQGKTLFPAVTFRNLTVHVNFGSLPMVELPFNCRALQDAAEKDCEVATETKPKSGVFDVLFPVCLPDQGTFDWLDFFLEKNPSYVELSDRMILDWAEKSGIWRTNGYCWKASNDKPDMQFGVPSLDDGSIKKMLYSIASAQQRNFVIMEVRGNLIKEERQAILKKFSAPHLRVTAQVLVGEPTKEFKERSQSLILHDKQERHDLEWRVKQQEEINRKRAEKVAKLQARDQKKAERARKEAEAAQKAVADPAATASEGNEGEQKTDCGVKAAENEKTDDAEKKEEVDEDDSELDAKIAELVAAMPPKVQLTDDERKQFFRKPKTTDLTPMLLSSTFTGFTLPEKEEGFVDVRYEWLKKTKSAEYVKDWTLNLKLTTRVEDLQPGEWFTKQWSSWQQQVAQWQSKKAEIEVAQKAEAVKAAAEREAKRRKIFEDERKNDEEKKEGEADEARPDNDKADEPAKIGDKETENVNHEKQMDDEDDEMHDDLDVFGVENVLDVGRGRPLFSSFTWEDWALMSVRYELYLLVHAFRKDVNDPERPGIRTEHIPFYYGKYFRKPLTTKNYGFETFEELVSLVRDTVTVNQKNSVLEVHVSDELDSFDLFVKLTEECRRERRLMLDAGNEAFALKLNQQVLQPAQVSSSSYVQQYQRVGWGNDQGKGYTKGGWQSGKDQGFKGSGRSYGGSSYKDGNYKGGSGKPVGGSYAMGVSPPVGGSQQYGHTRPYSGYNSGKGAYGR